VVRLPGLQAWQAYSVALAGLAAVHQREEKLMEPVCPSAREGKPMVLKQTLARSQVSAQRNPG
tara:strand:- start:762 stop:950 length:189 start_codon:yes stop_codon:yes gene_type:complete